MVKSEKQCFNNSGRLFMNKRNNNGRNIDPCGTPDFIKDRRDVPWP